MDAGRTPQPICQAHLPDQAANLPWYPRPTTTIAQLPAPIQPDALLMPPDDGLRLDNRHSVQHRRKQPIEPNEKQSIRQRQLRPRRYALAQHTQLVPQQNDLGFQLRLRLERRDQDVEEQDPETQSLRISLADLAAHASPDEVLSMDRRTSRVDVAPNKPSGYILTTAAGSLTISRGVSVGHRRSSASMPGHRAPRWRSCRASGNRRPAD